MVIIIKLLYEKYLENRLVRQLTIGKRNLDVSVSTLLLYGFVAAAAVMGIFDQTGTGAVPRYQSISSEFTSDRRFIEEIEKMMPAKAMIFQLPYVEYLGSMPLPGTISSYEHFKSYLHSKRLRWSFGAVVGRDTDKWQKQVSALPAAALVREITRKGFSGLSINRKGYADNGESLIREMRRVLQTDPVIQKNGSLVFFKLVPR
jgi:phosphoglycerol transferase